MQDEIDFLKETLDKLEIIRINLITMLAENQGDIMNMKSRIKYLAGLVICPDGCTCMRCEDK